MPNRGRAKTEVLLLSTHEAEKLPDIHTSEYVITESVGMAYLRGEPLRNIPGKNNRSSGLLLAIAP